MTGIWNELDNKLNSIIKICNGKTVVLWGYGYSGWFIEHWFARKNCNIDFIIDDGNGAHTKLNVYRSLILEDLDPEATVILLTMNENEDIKDLLANKGYNENYNYVFLKKYIYNYNAPKYISYQNWLDVTYGCDIFQMISIDSLEHKNKDSLEYSPGIDYTVIDICDKFVFDENDAVFDFGCGKGGALLLFQKSGIGKIGGVEYSREVYDIAKCNFSKLGIDANGLINGDAADVTDILDSYNYFYFYNPFQGETFRKAIHNIEESIKRKNRKATIIYVGPYCNRTVLKNGIFILSKKIHTDCSVRDVNIYINNKYK